ncbi:hypothetical protein [Aquimonas voraii]|nr:hypothetical protein [Aquimonas voraii]
MSREDLLTVGLRLFAIWLGLASLQSALGAYGWAGPGSDWAEDRVWMVGIALLPGLVALALWVFPLAVVSRLLPRSSDSHVPVQGGREALRDTGLILLGLWWLLSGLVDTVHVFSLMLLDLTVEIRAPLIADLLSALVASAAGAILLLRGPSLVGALRRVSKAAADDANTVTAETTDRRPE